MLSHDLCNQYIQQHPYGLASGTAEQLMYSWAAYCRHCGQRGVAALNSDLANAWLDEMRIRCAPDTCRTQRGNLLAIWWWAYREGIVSEPPLRVRRLRPIHRSPEAWTLQEVRQLIATAAANGPYWESLVRTGYDTALRLGDLLRLRGRDVGELLRIRQQKTGRLVSVLVRPETLEVLRRHLDGREPGELVWPLWGRREAFYRAVRLLVAAAGIERGTFRWLRRSAITQLERIAPGKGTLLAGHRSRSTTETWYIDVSQLRGGRLPPL